LAFRRHASEVRLLWREMELQRAHLNFAAGGCLGRNKRRTMNATTAATNIATNAALVDTLYA
jgi:hypothetical protein